ncbi:MAG: hypothetical protein CME26_00040 [Gemmatimonadetes bacterium]|nr:hypothetical protein [Gemmatimonadota bacterium]|tara:strand:+ start:5862 stop:7253 length:1392 start_codon:yes stop_codon:yes gene_type:complete
MPLSRAALVVLLLCLASRLLSAIYYVEDPDSLRFALSIVDYDVSRLQPHFPAYPVFCWLVKGISLVTGRFAPAFAIMGGLSTWVTILCVVAISREKLTDPKGLLIAGLVFLNPMIWLLGNRYMPDLAGLACLLGAFVFLTQGHRPVWGAFLSGLLAGIRLSYLPFAIVPWGFALWSHSGDRLRILGASLGGVFVWAIPLIWITGFPELIEAARNQSAGHFLEFGGSIATEPHLVSRLSKLVEAVVADGFGLYWTDRHFSTAIATSAICLCVGPVLVPVWRKLVEDPIFRLHLASWTVYLLWIYFGQNVVHKSRHAMPLLPLIVLTLAQAVFIDTRAKDLRRIAFILFVLAHGYVTFHLVNQHTSPSAISQVKDYLQSRSSPNLHIVTVPLVEFYLSSQEVKGTYITIEDPSDVADIAQVPTGAEVFTIGSPHSFPMRPLKSQKTFFHNPYVNRMWPEIGVYEY